MSPGHVHGHRWGVMSPNQQQQAERSVHEQRCVENELQANGLHGFKLINTRGDLQDAPAPALANTATPLPPDTSQCLALVDVEALSAKIAADNGQTQPSLVVDGMAALLGMFGKGGKTGNKKGVGKGAKRGIAKRPAANTAPKTRTKAKTKGAAGKTMVGMC